MKNESISPLIYPERSRLYQLQPLRVGTAYCESLTSYIQRLAQSHSLSVLTLIKEHIAPQIRIDYIHNDALRGCSRFFNRSNGLNGTGKFSRHCVQALEMLTKRTDISILTLQRYEEVLVSKKLCRSNKSWCPDCYYLWQEQNQPIYDPLLWSITEVNVCSIHERPLEYLCPNSFCNKLIPTLSSFLVVGFCPYCGQWLGQTNKDQLRLKPAEKDLWISQSLGKLVEHNDLKEPFKKENISFVINQLCTQLTNGNIEALGKTLNIHKSTIYQYHTGKFTPFLNTLLDLSYHAQIPLLDFILAKPINIITQNSTPRPTYGSKRARIIWAEVEKQLLKTSCEIPPPSSNTTSKRLMISYKSLKKKNPELMSTIRENYKTYVSQRAELRITTIQQDVISATQALHCEGKTPTAKAVEKKLGQRAVLRRKVFYDTWKDVRRSFVA